MGRHKERITPDDNMMSSIVKLAEGNPGAVTAMGSMAQVAEKIDPLNWLGAYGPLINLDTLGIYGHRIWMLFKDVCKQDPVKCVGLLRATTLGIIDIGILNVAIEEGGGGLDVEGTIDRLKERIPSFAA